MWEARPSCKQMQNVHQQQQQWKKRSTKSKKVICYNKCEGFAHIARKTGMFASMTIHIADSQEDDVMKNKNST